MAKETKQENYDASEIQVLKGLEAVRKRPGMYIGSTSAAGLHHLVYEVIDNSIDECMAGYGKEIDVTIHEDGSCSVADHGRGIPIDMHKSGKPALEVVLTELHAGGKFNASAYKVSGGLHGVGVSVVNALSDKMIAEVHRDGKIAQIEFSRGHVTKKMKIVGQAPKKETGTTITFYPDATMFETTVFEYSVLRRRFKELAFLNSGLVINFTDERDKNDEGVPRKESYHYEGGITTFVQQVAEREDSVVNKDVVYFKAEYTNRKVNFTDEATGKEDIRNVTDIIEVAFQYCSSYNEKGFSFVNNINTVNGGTHARGFKSGLVQVINKFARDWGFLKKDTPDLKQKDVEEGLVSVVSIKFPEPQFEGQTKGALGSSEALAEVKDATVEFVTRFFEQNPTEGKKIVEKNCVAAAAREAARKAKELARNKKEASKVTISGKLANCSSKKPEECEIYLVEGDSAGGSAKQGRDRRTQAILPLRGKILNVEKGSMNKILANQEIQTMISCFGCGIHDDYDESKLRYHKVVIMTDADVDGAHIRTLMLTFFFRYMPDLIKNGHVYIAQPPLFLVKKGKQHWYTYNDAEQEALLNKIGTDGITIQRYKGLGEMNATQLFETTMNPEERTIVQCSVEDAEDADETFNLLMGNKVEPRRKYIQENAHRVMNLDF